MCDCQACTQWMKEARGFVGNYQCTNSVHCICCEGGSQSCVGCNHFQVPLTQSDHIHFHANISRKDKCEYTDDDWIIVYKMEKLKLKNGTSLDSMEVY